MTERSSAPLSQHQADAVDWIHRVGRGLLADEPGLGKSRSAIESFDGGRVLVVAPAMVVVGGTWADELAKWSDHPEKFTVTKFTDLNLRERTGKGSATRPTDKVKSEFKGPWDALVVDEAHYVKNRNTHWTKSVRQISKHADSLMLMTGTPMPNWAHELFSLIQLMNPEESKPGARFGSRNRWLNEWFVRMANPYSSSPGSELVGDLLGCTTRCKSDGRCDHYDKFVRENLGAKFLRRLRDDVLDLPPLTEQTIEVEMSRTQARMYRELKKDYLTTTDLDTEVVTWTLGSRNVALDRITTSDWFFDDLDATPRGGKLDRLAFDLGNRSAPTLVLAHYRQTVEACAQVASNVGARVAMVHGGVSDNQKSKVVSQFKGGELDVLIGSIETLAEGLTFTNADMVIFVEKSYKPSRNEQAMRRVHRMGQTRPVTVLDYVTPGTVDSNKRALLASKTDQQMRILSAAQYASLL